MYAQHTMRLFSHLFVSKGERVQRITIRENTSGCCFLLFKLMTTSDSLTICRARLACASSISVVHLFCYLLEPVPLLCLLSCLLCFFHLSRTHSIAAARPVQSAFGPNCSCTGARIRFCVNNASLATMSKVLDLSAEKKNILSL